MKIIRITKGYMIAEIGDRKIKTLSEAMDEAGTNRVGVLARSSVSISGIRERKRRLHNQKTRTVNAARSAGAKVRFISSFCESGRMSLSRPKFLHGLERCRNLGCIPCFEDVTRLIRAEAGRDCEPTLKELHQFWRRVDSAIGHDWPVAVIHDPHIPRSELQGLRTSLGMAASDKKPGRPTHKIPISVFLRILNLRGNGEEGLWGESRIQSQLKSEGIDISRRQVTKVLDWPFRGRNGDLVRIRDFVLMDQNYFFRLVNKQDLPSWIE